MASKRHRKNIKNITNAASEKTFPASADIFKKEITYPTTLYRTRQDISTWRSAVNMAENVQNPNRTELYRLYKDVMNDAFLTALIDTRKNAILSKIFIVTKNGKFKLDKTEYITKKWLYQFINLALDSIIWGFSLIKFNYSKTLDEFVDVQIVPRHYVKPEFDIVADIHSKEGVNYLEGIYPDWYIPVGDKDSLGLLMKASPLFLWKRGALSNWAEYCEKYGTPMRIVKTDTTDAATHQNAVDMLSKMGSSLWAVLGKADEFDIKETSNTSASDIFENLIKICNDELATLILGQSSTSTQKAYTGAAGVHERVMHQVNAADLMFIENVFSYQLIPFLNRHGLGFNGYKIEAKPDNTINLIDKGKFDIELLRLGIFTVDPQYILDTYGTPVVPITPTDKKETAPDKNIDTIENRLKGYYDRD